MAHTEPTAITVSNYELCRRKAWYKDWQRLRIRPVEAIRRAVFQTLTATPSKDDTFGDMAGSVILELAASPGLDVEIGTAKGQVNLYGCAMHHAVLADILVSALRKPNDAAWLGAEPVQNWTSGCLMSPEGDRLRRILLVTNWNDARLEAETRGWHTVGEIAQYNLPMQIVVLVLGPERWGKRHSHWTKGLLHPSNRKHLRFKRRAKSTHYGNPNSDGFKETWLPIWREDHDEITRESWLNAMFEDDVLRELCFRVDVPVLDPRRRQEVLDLAQRKLEAIENMREKPEKNLTQCDWPISCQFKNCCHARVEREPSEALDFVKVEELRAVSEQRQRSPQSVS